MKTSDDQLREWDEWQEEKRTLKNYAIYVLIASLVFLKLGSYFAVGLCVRYDFKKLYCYFIYG